MLIKSSRNATREADEFYSAIQPPKATEDEKHIQRQAFAGLLWSKQSYLFDVNAWLEGDNPNYPPAELALAGSQPALASP